MEIQRKTTNVGIWAAYAIPESRRSIREGNGNPIQYSCLENSMDREACQTTVHGVAKSQTQVMTNTFTFTLCELDKAVGQMTGDK